MKKTGSRILLVILLILAVAGFLYLMNYLFDHTEVVPGIFSGAAREQVFGRVEAGSGATIAAQDVIPASSAEVNPYGSPLEYIIIM